MRPPACPTPAVKAGGSAPPSGTAWWPGPRRSSAPRAVGVPCAPYNTPISVFDDPQIAANGFLVELDHPTLGRYVMPAPPVRMSRTPTRAQGPSPLLGADTEEIFEEVGLPPAVVARLRRAGVVGGPPH